jgi:ABC-type microcin C transport system permease subunit YejE
MNSINILFGLALVAVVLLVVVGMATGYFDIAEDLVGRIVDELMGNMPGGG